MDANLLVRDSFLTANGINLQALPTSRLVMYGVNIAFARGTYGAVLDGCSPIIISDCIFAFNLGMWAPKGTPRDVIGRLVAATAEAAKAPAVQDKMKSFAMVVQPTSPEEQLKVFEREIGAYAEAAKLIGYQPQ